MVGRPDGRGQGVVHAVGQGQGLVVGGELLNGQDRPEDLLLHECVVLLEPRDDSGRVVVPALANAVTTGQQVGVCGPLLNDLLHGGEVTGVVQGAVERLLLRNRTGPQGLDVTHQRIGELLGHRGLDQHAGGGGAVLPGVERPCGGDALGSRLDVGIGEDDGGGLASQLEVNTSHVSGRLFSEIRAGAH